jgi:hypothetical protein
MFGTKRHGVQAAGCAISSLLNGHDDLLAPAFHRTTIRKEDWPAQPYGGFGLDGRSCEIQNHRREMDILVSFSFDLATVSWCDCLLS